MTLVRVNKADSGDQFSILNLQAITRVDCRNFAGEREERRVTLFFSDGGSMVLTGADADRVINALVVHEVFQDFVHYPR